MIKVLIFSERNLEELVKTIMVGSDISQKTKSIFINFYREKFSSLTGLFCSLFTNLSHVFHSALSPELDINENELLHVSNQFKLSVKDFDINKLYTFDIFDVVYKEVDIISSKVDSYIYDSLYEFIENNCEKSEVNDIFDIICFIILYILEHIEYHITNLLEDSNNSLNGNYAYIVNKNNMLFFYLYVKDILIRMDRKTLNHICNPLKDK